MKRFLIIILVTSVVSYSFGNYIFVKYKDNIENIVEASTSFDTIYMILYGSYNKKEKVDKLDINNYLMIKEGNYYKVYVGITKDYSNALKIKDIYKDMNADTYIKQKGINNLKFLDYLNDVDNFSDLSNDEILLLEKNIINKYKEMFDEQ